MTILVGDDSYQSINAVRSTGRRPGAVASSLDKTMTDHKIRLRGGWELWDANAPDRGKPPGRISLPHDGPPGVGQRVRLVRHFQRPPLDPGTEILELTIENVPGLTRLSINGVDLVPRPEADGSFRVGLGDDLPARNRLVLEVEAADARTPAASLWGHVALVIRGRAVGPTPSD